MTPEQLREIAEVIKIVNAGSLNENLGYQRLLMREYAPALLGYVVELLAERQATRAAVQGVAVSILTDLP